MVAIGIYNTLGDFIAFALIGALQVGMAITWIVLIFGYRIAPNKSNLLSDDDSGSSKNISSTTRNVTPSPNVSADQPVQDTNIEIVNPAKREPLTETESDAAPRPSNQSKEIVIGQEDDTKIEAELEKETAHRRVKRRVRKMPMISKMHSTAKRLTTAALIAASLYMVLHSVNAALSHISSELQAVIDVVDTLAGIFQRWFLYLYFLERIEITFANTMFSMGQNRHKRFKILLNVTFTITALVVIFSDIYQATEGNDDMEILQIFVSLLNDCFWAFTLMIMFVSKLRSIIKISESFSDAAKQKDSAENVRDLKYLMAKSCILIIVAVLSTWLFTGMYAGTGILSFIGFDFLVNSMCLILTFAFMNNWYKMLCLPCRLCCEPKNK